MTAEGFMLAATAIGLIGAWLIAMADNATMRKRRKP
jgi:hypothetical protein